MFSNRRKNITVLLAVAAVAAIASGAYAYQERTVVARVTTPPNTGCILESSALNHATGTDPMQIVMSATVPGRTRRDAGNCNNDWPVGRTVRISGEAVGFVIKLISQGTDHDSYFLCQGSSGGVQTNVSELKLDVTYPTPPCGPGHYALIACLQNVTTTATRLFWPTIRGSFSYSNMQTDCNVSPNWHPAGVGDSITPIGPVKL